MPINKSTDSNYGCIFRLYTLIIGLLGGILFILSPVAQQGNVSSFQQICIAWHFTFVLHCAVHGGNGKGAD